MNTERASYFTERSYTTSEAENKKDIFEYWKKILGEDTLRVAEKCYGIDLVKVLNSENYVCENNHVMSEMEKVKIELFEKPINYNYSGFKGEKLAFDNFFIPLINYGIDILKNGTSLFWTDSIIDTYANTLLERLGKISLGILMFEMYLCKKTGKLNGRNSEEEYDYYNNNFLSKKSYKQELFNIYPCLLRSVTETVENLSSYYVLLLERLNKDKNEIANKFCGGLEFKNVVEISSNISDSHKKGNGVSILKLDNGTKIVYKPRSLKIEKVYFDFLGKINAGCKYEMYEPKILDCQEYGWEEFVYYKSCKTEDEIRRYFYRFGILIFGSYILNTNDLHEENVIAAGEYPIIIDAETILDNRRRGRTNSAKEEINYILHESVLYSGLLPHYRFSNLGQGVDMSAIKGSEGKEYPIVIPKIADLCTSNMRFVYEHPTTGVNQNLVKLDGENVSAFHYLKEINAGFEDAYKYVLENKEKFLEYADMFGNLNIRHLVQDTQRYSMLLHTSFHPDFMQDGRDRQMFLCSLFKQYEATQGDKGVVKCEIKDMLNMDIPYFYLNTSGKSLFGSEGEKIEDYFEYTSLEHLKKKIVLLDEDDLKRQLMFMNIILTEINEFQVEDKKIELQQMKMIPHREKNKAHLLKAVQKLADSLIKTAVFNKDRTEVNWIGVTLIGNEDDCSWDIRPLGTYLYEGMSGLAIFFNALYAVDPQKEYLIIRNAIEKELFTYTDEMCERNEGIENESSGAFGGEASIMYTYEVLYKITNKEKYLDYAKKHYKILKKAITRDNSFDLVYGNAGAVITLINMYQLMILNQKARIKVKNYIADQSALQARMVETLTNIQQIRCMRIENMLSDSLKQDYKHLIKRLRERVQISDIMESVVGAFSIASSLILYVIGGYLVCDNRLELGTLIAFVTLAGYFTGPFQTLSLVVPQINVLKETMIRLKELMNYKSNRKNGTQHINSFESMEMQQVTFSYYGSTKPDVENVSMMLKKGEKIAFVGSSGSGKTTITKLLLNVFSHYQGQILVNGEDIKQICKEDIDRIFAIVTQVPMAMNGTIRENVDITNTLTDEEIYHYLDLVELKDDIEKFPLGLNTFVGENGQNISGGQKQRIAIARALALKPEVIIFDEATSNLDPLTERRICNDLKQLHITQIVVTHRLNAIQDADTIYVVEKGKIIESGTHVELLQLKGAYYDSVNN